MNETIRETIKLDTVTMLMRNCAWKQHTYCAGAAVERFGKLACVTICNCECHV